MNADYRIEHHDHGIAIYGAVPVDELTDLIEMWGRKGFKLIDSAVSSAIGATMAVVKSNADGEAWCKAISATPENPHWLLSGDTGRSSLTIYSVLSGDSSRGDRPSIPYDPADFGRCYRLLKRYPAWVARLPEVAAAYPIWTPFVREWARLTGMYEREMPSGKCPDLYEAMRKLVDEARGRGAA